MRLLIISCTAASLLFFNVESFASNSGSQVFSNDEYHSSLTSDFATRDKLPQTEVLKEQWETCCGSWGPRPLLYPSVKAPKEYSEVQWSRDRIIEVAKKYVGLPYLHHHIPDMGGLDCSNFSSWVYNYGLGIGIISNVHQQALTAGRKVSSAESLEPGDLVFIYSQDKSQIAHVVIYISESEIIDSTDTGVKVRKFTGWYKDRFAWARRVVE